MSTKAYAGVMVFRPYGIYSTMSGNPGYILCPFDGLDDFEVFSRLGYPWTGSGPWFKCRRVVDPSYPSTDGTFEAGYRFARYGATYTLQIQTADYNIFRDLSISGSTSATRTMSFKYVETTFRRAERNGRYTVGTFDVSKTVSQTIPEEASPISYRAIQAIAGNWSRMLDLVNSHGSLLGAVPIKTQDRYSYREVVSARSFVLDLAPPYAVYRGVLDDAQLYIDTGILPGSWARGLETAFIEAGKNLPQAATNVAANVLEAAELLYSLFTGKFLGELPKNARQAWLAYRYAYTTTKLDIREVKNVFSRLDSMLRENHVATYGSYVRGGINYRVGYEVDTAQIVPSDVSSTLRRFGLELNATNVWDIIPFSFVVDWFLPVQEVLEYFQDLGACSLEPKDLWWSITTVIDGYQIYVRLPGRKLSTLPYLQLTEASHKTIALRVADAVALFAP